ncbi:MAG: nitroreductase family protein [Thermoplasmata archaeon]|jgi:nitroreductase|nr:nitroreductase family protein [Thermoplasmata archaeon]HDN95669.1 nitroreductase family protein [Thermoplasmatales archaeon]
MEVKEAIEKRRSIRKYKSKDVELSIVEKLLYYANLAPSAGNLQARDFIIVDDKELKKKIARAAYNQEFVEEAPVLVVFCANLKRIAPYGERGKNLYCIQDVAAAIQNFLLAALDEGLATCWVGAFDENEVSRLLGLPSEVRPVAIITLGYGDEEAYSDRMDIKKLIHYNGW